MSVEQRVKICRLLEKIEFEQEYSQKLGIVNKSTFRGAFVLPFEIPAEGNPSIRNS
jgi:hypothetical protein